MILVFTPMQSIPTNYISIHMKFSMTGQEKFDLLIEVTS
jgi:hypothetical protein